ncbi:hypothetical protein ACFOLJ_08270 [Rugamonas sp. CCM 8940]|uniref:hypothetical protein n=1 Tax=Rugamonas sp. CCM 8940 TaxID=2765359 RepID=UPI0018F3DB66|nr:hypothetical protein [Rugamonas sp. CCM 8940]MBJ7309930.1 hypothetical protein [Rugamonas sp. CCM 8940]
MPRWTDAARAKQAALIARWKPWEAATGPRTTAGKAKAARNADKGGDAGRAQRLADAQVELMAALAKVLQLAGRRRAK